MPHILNTSITSLNARSALDRTQLAQSQSIARLSSGLRVNNAGDDAAGLAISDRMTAQIRGVGAAVRNTQDGISLVQTADGGLSSLQANLQRLRELAVQAANASNSASDRAATQSEAAQLLAEMDRVARQTSFNGMALLDGSIGSQDFQVGAGNAANQRITLGGLASARTSVLGATAGTPAPPVVSTTIAAGSGLSAASTIDGPGQLVINGVDVYQGATIGADASLIAGAINAAGIAGLSAAAAPNTMAGTWAAAGGLSETFIFNNVSCWFGLNGDRNLDVSTAVNIFNTVLAAIYVPGLSAVDNGNGMTLTMSGGQNISLGSSTGIAGLGMGGLPTGPSESSPLVTYSSYSITYTGSAGLSISGSRVSSLGLVPLAPPAAPTVGGTPPIAQIDLSTVGGANTALTSIDNAMLSIDQQRATLGAVQNRFDSVIRDLDTESTNTLAARGRIVDADYASETTNLARSQILQNAGLAMVAQANTAPSWVLALLR